MENEILSRDVHFYDLCKILIRRLWIIILAAFLAIGAVIGYDWLQRRTPEPVTYTSITTIRVYHTSESSAGTSVALNFMPDLVNIVRHTNVMYSVYEELQPQLVDRNGNSVTYQQFLKCVTFDQPERTRFLHIKVTWHDEAVAKLIANAICEEGIQQMTEFMGDAEKKNITMKTDSNVTRETLTQDVVPPIKSALLCGAMVAVITITVIVILYFMDNRVRSGDDLEKTASMSVLGNIPDAGDVLGIPNAERIPVQKNVSSGGKKA